MRQNKLKLTQDEIKKLCTAGGMAPSGGNLQPWRVVIRANHIIELRLDPVRSSSFLDIGHYGAFFGLGCFFENLCIVAQSLGLEFTVEKLTYHNINDPIVRISFTGRKMISRSTVHPLYTSIEKRVTNRHIFNGTIIADKEIAVLKKVVFDFKPNFCLHTLETEPEKQDAAKILGKADGIRILHRELFTQMMDEIRWTEAETVKTKNGIDIKTLEMPKLLLQMIKLMKTYPFMRFLFPRKVFENMAKPIIVGCSHLCCFSMAAAPDPQSLFEAGQVTERLWLTATKLKLAVHPWTILPFFMIRVHYFEGRGFSKWERRVITDSGKDLQQLFHLEQDEIPIFIFRLSIAQPPSARSLRIGWKYYTEVLN